MKLGEINYDFKINKIVNKWNSLVIFVFWFKLENYCPFNDPKFIEEYLNNFF